MQATCHLSNFWAYINVTQKADIKMEWTITLNEEDQYVETLTCGVADKDGSLAIAKAISTALN